MSLIKSIATGAISSAAKSKSRGRGLLGFGAGIIASRVAMRSVPGAVIVGGALLAKALYDRHRKKLSE